MNQQLPSSSSQESFRSLPEQNSRGSCFSIMSGEQRRQIRIDREEEMLTARIHRRLLETGRRPLAELRVSVQDGCVRMSGKVPSYYAKQLAHQAALSVDGVERIDCAIDVE